MPIGFRLSREANVNILTGGASPPLQLIDPSLVQTVRVQPETGMTPSITNHTPLVFTNTNAPAALENTPSAGSGKGNATATEMVTISVTFRDPGPEDPREGIIGAYVDIERF